MGKRYNKEKEIAKFNAERKAIGHEPIAFHAECECGFKTNDDNVWLDHGLDVAILVMKGREAEVRKASKEE